MGGGLAFWAVAVTFTATPTEDGSRLARRFFEAGEQNYAAGRYSEAIKNYERAYELSRRDALLFNLANAYERNGNYDPAADVLQRFLTSAPAVDRVALEQRIDSLRARARSRAEEQAELEELRAYQTWAEQRLREVAPAPPGRPKWPGLLVGGVGVAMLGASLVTGIAALSAGDQAETDCLNRPGGTVLCDREARDALREEANLGSASDVLLGAGLAAVTTAGVLLWFSSRPQAEGSATVIGVRGAF